MFWNCGSSEPPLSPSLKVSELSFHRIYCFLYILGKLKQISQEISSHINLSGTHSLWGKMYCVKFWLSILLQWVLLASAILKPPRWRNGNEVMHSFRRWESAVKAITLAVRSTDGDCRCFQSRGRRRNGEQISSSHQSDNWGTSISWLVCRCQPGAHNADTTY